MRGARHGAAPGTGAGERLIEELPDRRALGYPGRPYSAYCKVCWLPVYIGWIDKDHLPGPCIEGATNPLRCGEAIRRNKLRAQIAELRRKGLIY